jgi:hypothetical protein
MSTTKRNGPLTTGHPSKEGWQNDDDDDDGDDEEGWGGKENENLFLSFQV